MQFPRKTKGVLARTPDPGPKKLGNLTSPGKRMELSQPPAGTVSDSCAAENDAEAEFEAFLQVGADLLSPMGVLRPPASTSRSDRAPTVLCAGGGGAFHGREVARIISGSCSTSQGHHSVVARPGISGAGCSRPVAGARPAESDSAAATVGGGPRRGSTGAMAAICCGHVKRRAADAEGGRSSFGRGRVAAQGTAGALPPQGGARPPRAARGIRGPDLRRRRFRSA